MVTQREQRREREGDSQLGLREDRGVEERRVWKKGGERDFSLSLREDRGRRGGVEEGEGDLVGLMRRGRNGIME